jgi:hypothetical protein
MGMRTYRRIGCCVASEPRDAIVFRKQAKDIIE